jgi:phage head maturation protease
MGEDWRKEKGVSIRELKDLDLFDVSPVTFPAYEATTVGVRGAGDLADVRTSLEEWEQKEASRMVTEVVAKNRARALKIITGLAEIENP